MGELRINYQYPNSPDFDYESYMERINMDIERENDLINDRGFIISEPQSLKKDLKSMDSIFSTRFGQTLQDVNPYANRYRCTCGHLNGRVYNGTKCRVCGTEVKYVDDDFGYFGWIVLKDPYYIIHPNLFKSLEFLIGTNRFNNILNFKDAKDQDGFSVDFDVPKDEPYFGLGILDFKDRFDEILDFYLSKNPNKKDYYDDIMLNRGNVFIQSIPVYTTHLRPYKVDMENFHFEGTNAIYNMMAKIAYSINKDNLKMFRKKKTKNDLLYDLQMKYKELYKELENLLSSKKGKIRSLFGGRYNFSSRNVIVPSPMLRIDEVRLPYHALVELLQQSIINILKKSYNMSYNEAYDIWYKSQVEKSEQVYNIIQSIINNYDRGIPIIINRNPTINYGGILQMFVVGINDNYTMSVPLQPLALLAADFDGDVLNILYIINREFFIQANRIFNPRNALYISRNDGKFNNAVNHGRDTLINSNTLINLSRKYYTPEQLEKIRRIKESA